MSVVMAASQNRNANQVEDNSAESICDLVGIRVGFVFGCFFHGGVNTSSIGDTMQYMVRIEVPTAATVGGDASVLEYTSEWGLASIRMPCPRIRRSSQFANRTDPCMMMYPKAPRTLRMPNLELLLGYGHAQRE
jgi:hypothetical protein